MTLPFFTLDDVLPAGDYPMTLEEPRNSHLVTGANNPSGSWDRIWRGKLVTNLSLLVRQLWQVGIDRIFVDGSFAENKDHPNDIDGYFETDISRIVTGSLVLDLNALDPYQAWTWNHAMRRPDPNSTKLQLPLWHKYRVEMYPHFGQPTGIVDQYGNNLLFPAAFRKSRTDHRPKGIVQVVK
jgi:hypothetical protein